MPQTLFINSLISHNDLKMWVPLLYYMKEEGKTQTICANCGSSPRWWGTEPASKLKQYGCQEQTPNSGVG